MLLSAFCKLSEYKNDGRALDIVEVGTPIIVYKAFGPEWLRCDNLKSESGCIVDLCLSKLSVICDKIIAAGVVRLDLRIQFILSSGRERRRRYGCTSKHY